LGWHDAGTYDKNITEWPKCGGANGSLRFEIELKHAANAGTASPPLIVSCFAIWDCSYVILIVGLVNALKLIQTIKDKYSGATYADLFQLASATAIEVFYSALADW
jgi:L-ascorbate peroxidase